MSVNDPKAGKVGVSYVLTMSNDYKAEVTIYSGNDIEKKTYLKHFLETSRDEDVYFVDNLDGTLYNKLQIVSCKEKK
jgi:hypothetical protein